MSICNGVFRTLPNIYDGPFLQKQSTVTFGAQDVQCFQRYQRTAVNYFRKTSDHIYFHHISSHVFPSYILDRLPNTLSQGRLGIMRSFLETGIFRTPLGETYCNFLTILKVQCLSFSLFLYLTGMVLTLKITIILELECVLLFLTAKFRSRARIMLELPQCFKPRQIEVMAICVLLLFTSLHYWFVFYFCAFISLRFLSHMNVS